MPRCADASCVRWRPTFGVWGGVRLNGTWFCSRSCAATAVRRGLESPPAVGESAGSLPPLRVGALLRHQGAITQLQLDEALVSQRKSGLRLGAELQRLGFVSSATLVRALAAQAGVSYLTSVDPARVRRAPGGLSADMVRALGLLPFEAQDTRLHVICTAPLPRPALRALARLTGWTAEPYLVDDAVWERALEGYTPEAVRDHRSEVVHDVTEASAHVVAAAAGRDAVVRYAGCGDFVWVRVEGGARTQDVLIQPSYVEAGL
jgi:type II secretion system (T2SS) protein E